jgi:hypothetical protein
MLWRKKEIVVKKEIIPPHLVDPMKRKKTFKQTKFDKYDIPGEKGKSIRKIFLFILILFAYWFIYNSYLAWNFYQ